MELKNRKRINDTTNPTVITVGFVFRVSILFYSKHPFSCGYYNVVKNYGCNTANS